jgi:hypothetical protein
MNRRQNWACFLRQACMRQSRGHPGQRDSRAQFLFWPGVFLCLGFCLHTMNGRPWGLLWSPLHCGHIYTQPGFGCGEQTGHQPTYLEIEKPHCPGPNCVGVCTDLGNLCANFLTVSHMFSMAQRGSHRVCTTPQLSLVLVVSLSGSQARCSPRGRRAFDLSDPESEPSLGMMSLTGFPRNVGLQGTQCAFRSVLLLVGFHVWPIHSALQV